LMQAKRRANKRLNPFEFRAGIHWTQATRHVNKLLS